MTVQYLIGVDLGTSGTKTVLFDVHGKEIASALEEYPLYQPYNGWAEQEPEDRRPVPVRADARPGADGR